MMGFLKRVSGLGIVAAMVLVAGCARFDPLRGVVGSYRNYVEVNGTIKDGRYYDPYGRFSMRVPPLVTPGMVASGRMAPEGGTLTFSDDFGALVRVDLNTAQTPEELAVLEKLDTETLLQRNREMIGMLCRQAVPSATLRHQEYFKHNGKTLDYFVYAMPQGSTMVQTCIAQGERTVGRLSAWRASIGWVAERSLFTLTVQYIPSGNETAAFMAELELALKAGLVELLDGVQFSPPLAVNGLVGSKR